MYELARRRFMKKASAIAQTQTKLGDASKDLHAAFLRLEALLSTTVEQLRAVGVDTPELKQIEGEIAYAWDRFNEHMPAVESVQLFFDDAAVELARIVGALPNEG